MTAEEVAERKRAGYRPYAHLDSDPELARVIDLIASGAFSPGDRGMFAPLVDDLAHRDPFLVLADFRAYIDKQREVDAAWQSRTAWTRSSILNSARGGKFSSDRSIAEYAKHIWRVAPVKPR
jgi:starch phosphorylase